MSYVRGVIFDLDGTLVDSALDFDAIRTEMALLPEQSVLEALATMCEPRATECRAILDRHEQAGVERATPMPGAIELVDELRRRRIHVAVLTRNRRGLAEATLQRCGLAIEIVIGREDAPPKPDPAAIWHLCAQWQLQPHEVAIVGDYHFDIEAGRLAGARTILYTGGADLTGVDWAGAAETRIDCFQRSEPLLALLAEAH